MWSSCLAANRLISWILAAARSADQVATAIKLILSDPNVKAVLINIFGGITRGDEVASGILEALNQVETDIPMVVRLAGTNAAEGMDDFGGCGYGNGRYPFRCRPKSGCFSQGGRLIMSILVDKNTRLVVPA